LRVRPPAPLATKFGCMNIFFRGGPLPEVAALGGLAWRVAAAAAAVDAAGAGAGARSAQHDITTFISA
jgi:hypothetical protein